MRVIWRKIDCDIWRAHCILATPNDLMILVFWCHGFMPVTSIQAAGQMLCARRFAVLNKTLNKVGFATQLINFTACLDIFKSENRYNTIRSTRVRGAHTAASGWGTPLGVPQYWFDQTWGKWAIIEGGNFFFINREVALSGRIWSELPYSNADGCFKEKNS